MQSIKSSMLRHLRVKISSGNAWILAENHKLPNGCVRQLCTSVGQSSDQTSTMSRVIELVKKFDGIEAAKVTETADFQKDLSLDSLDRVELVMAFEQEFSVEIPDEKAEKLTCCADVANYLISECQQKKATEKC